jgi:hypothetical protein
VGAMNASERLREAARLLREAAKEATPGPWDGWYDDSARPYWVVNTRRTGDRVAWHDVEPPHFYEEPHGPEGADAHYIALVDPVVGAALADWLDMIAAATVSAGVECSPTHPAMRVADAVLGET